MTTSGALPRHVVARRLAELVLAGGEPLADGAEILVTCAVPGEGASTTARLLVEGLSGLGRPAAIVEGTDAAPAGTLCIRDGGAVLMPAATDPLVWVPGASRILLVTLAGQTPRGVVRRAQQELERRTKVPVEVVLNDRDNPTVRAELAELAERIAAFGVRGRRPLARLVERLVERWVLVR